MLTVIFAASDHFPLKVSGNSNYTEEEKRVLEYTSHINSKVYVPFMSVDLNDRFHYPMPFTDKVNPCLLHPNNIN